MRLRDMTTEKNKIIKYKKNFFGIIYYSCINNTQTEVQRKRQNVESNELFQKIIKNKE